MHHSNHQNVILASPNEKLISMWAFECRVAKSLSEFSRYFMILIYIYILYVS